MTNQELFNDLHFKSFIAHKVMGECHCDELFKQMEQLAGDETTFKAWYDASPTTRMLTKPEAQA